MGITPDAYYDLTMPETEALLKGFSDKENREWQRTRVVAILLRNAHFANPTTPEKFLPLSGDDEQDGTDLPSQYTDPEVAFMMLGSVMGGEVTIEYINNES